MGDHMPVHLGSMPMSVRAAIAAGKMAPRDVVMLERSLPRGYASAGYYSSRARVCRARPLSPRKAVNRPDFYVASRAHHADVGGAYAGSMGLCPEIHQEGIRIPR
jgi:N-methylhydantoinase B